MSSDKPWLTEPARLEWEHAGMRCLILRHPTMRHLCGYVRVPSDDILYGKEYDALNEWVDVHGGLTFSGHLDSEGDEWWVGFDCAHAGDLVPSISDLPVRFRAFGDTYKDIAYVQAETNRLAEQLAARGKR